MPETEDSNDYPTPHPDELRKKFPEDWVEQFRKDGETLDFVPWHRYVQKLLDSSEDVEFWTSEIRDVTVAGERLIMVVRVGINGIHHEGTGTAKAGKTKWGGAHAEAYSQAFRRACAHHGLGLYFYHDDEEVEGKSSVDATAAQQERLKQLAQQDVFSEEEIQEWKDRLVAGGMTKQVAGAVIREMKDLYEDRTGHPFDPDSMS